MLGCLLLIVMLNQQFYSWLALLIGRDALQQVLSETDLACLLTLGICTILIFLFAEHMVELDIKVDEMDTSPEDYSVWVSNIPIFVPNLSPYDPEQQLTTFFETAFKREMKVAEICLCYNLGPMNLMKHAKKELLESYRNYYQDRDRKRVVSEILFNTNQLPYQMHEYYGVLPSSEANDKLKLKNIEEGYVEELQTINQTINRGYFSSDLLFLGKAVISFEFQDMK